MQPEQFLQFAAELPEAMLLLRTDGEIVSANSTACRQLARTCEELIGRRLQDHLVDPPEKIEQTIRMAARSRSLTVGGLTIQSETGPVHFRSEGFLVQPHSAQEPAAILLRLIPREHSSQNFILLNRRVDEYAQEIRRRRQVEAELRTQREWLHVTLTSIGDAVITTDEAGRVTLMNPTAEKLTGWTAEEAEGRPLYDVFEIVNERTRQPAENPVDKVLEAGCVVGLANHTVLIARDGSERPIDDTAAPIRGGDEDLRGVVLVFHDVSDRRTMERQLKQRADDLEESDRRKDEFIAVLAHELRNPLAPIRAAGQVLKLGSARPEAVQQVADIVERQSDHLSALVDDLLDVSRVTRGKISLRRERLDFGEIVRVSADAYRQRCESSDVAFEVDLPDCPLWVDADRTRITQIIENLLDNACKFTDEGGAIAVRLAADPGGRCASLSIRDTGMGLEPEMKKRLFIPFAQADRTLDRSKGGLGLGLALVKGLVDLHEGEIAAKSDGPGRGAEFVVRLPLADPPVDAPAEGAPADEAATLAAPPGLRVLVIEDNRDVANMVSMLLRLLGHEVLQAHTGNQGIELARTELPDVVLCDIGLPGISGHDVARSLRKDPTCGSLRLIALSGYGQAEDKRQAREAGFDGHLTKPVDVNKLRESLNGRPQ
jgi:PAS domain S-box-containing protein